MTSISYEEIFSEFLGNISDYTLASLDASDYYELLSEYLQKTLAQPYVRELFTSVYGDNDIQTLTYEMKYIIDEETDKNFVCNILANGMTVEWVKPQVRNRVNLAQMFSNKEAKFYSQSTHIAELRGLLEDTQIEIKKQIRDRGYLNNNYLGGN